MLETRPKKIIIIITKRKALLPSMFHETFWELRGKFSSREFFIIIVTVKFSSRETFVFYQPRNFDRYKKVENYRYDCIQFFIVKIFGLLYDF